MRSQHSTLATYIDRRVGHGNVYILQVNISVSIPQVYKTSKEMALTKLNIDSMKMTGS
jgi:uncharacterized secreted protein with C-terminal beta-propeller domain